MNKLTITWCYPDILNLHGDRGNIMALERVGKMLDLDVEVKKIENYDEDIDFENTDILFFNPGELKSVEYIINALERQRKELKNYIEHNKYIIAIGECRERVVEFANKNKISVSSFEYLKDGFKKAYEVSKPKDIILLSPASASWDQYKECEERGDEFKKLVEEYKNGNY